MARDCQEGVRSQDKIATWAPDRRRQGSLGESSVSPFRAQHHQQPPASKAHSSRRCLTGHPVADSSRIKGPPPTPWSCLWSRGTQRQPQPATQAAARRVSVGRIRRHPPTLSVQTEALTSPLTLTGRCWTAVPFKDSLPAASAASPPGLPWPLANPSALASEP